jgi:predicted DsbA family dithiol-disulfide isomerase
MEQSMQVEIWSDIGCPWCYIGRRRFEKALAQFEHAPAVEVTWRSFELDPNAPRENAGSINELLMHKYRLSQQQVEAMQAQVTLLAVQEGLDFRMDQVQPVNTFDAHRLLHLAASHGLQSEMKERLQRAYFSEGRRVSDRETLVLLAVETGLDAVETRRVLEDPNAYADAVRADLRKARLLGINGVPFFVLAGKYGVSGAQPTQLLLDALNNAWEEAPQG